MDWPTFRPSKRFAPGDLVSLPGPAPTLMSLYANRDPDYNIVVTYLAKGQVATVIFASEDIQLQREAGPGQELLLLSNGALGWCFADHLWSLEELCPAAASAQ